ncbi:transmembrane protein 256 homolog [Ptychodera flava]|uniref:transmembrane protein 256 homolog n=1 Tax=Ptychodera flava TaxID=63121 RepID=UPI00396A3DCD
MAARLTRLNSVAGKIFFRVGALSGASAVLIAAHGAHSFKTNVDDPYRHQVFDVAKFYHFTTSLALLAVPLCGQPFIAGTLLASSIPLFSGTCYVHALYDIDELRKYTPHGGVLLVAGWAALAL